VSMNVILNRKAIYCIYSSRSVRPCVPTICYVVIVVIKLIKSLLSFFYDWLCTSGVVTRWDVCSGVWPLSCLSIYTVFVSTGLIYKAYSLGLVRFTGETLSVSFQKFCSTNGFDPTGVRSVTSGIRAKVLRP